MKLLLDTHALLWLVEGDSQLSQTATDLLVDPAHDLLLSPATYWEISIKISLGKYQLAEPLSKYFAEAIRLYGLSILPIEIAHAEAVVALPYHHKDPFDRMLIAQSIVEQVAVVSSDKQFDAYPVQRLW